MIAMELLSITVYRALDKERIGVFRRQNYVIRPVFKY